jgi:Ca2+-binding EF-hand superfamily protein
MGNAAPILCPVQQRDDVVERWTTTLFLTDLNLGSLWSKFSEAAENDTHILRRTDYFTYLMKTDRSFVGDALFRLIDKFDNEFMSFGDYVNISCTVSILTKIEMLQFCISMIDLKGTGFINIDELKFFIQTLWQKGEMNSLKNGFDYMDKSAQFNRGFVDLDYVKDLNMKFPQVLGTVLV